MSIHGASRGVGPCSSFYQSVCLPFPSLSPSVALSQQLESVSGKTLLVVHALWDKVATTSVTTDSGAVGRRRRAQQPEFNWLSDFVSHTHMLSEGVLTVHQDCLNRPGLLLHSHVLTG